jgi:hypothetical protein
MHMPNFRLRIAVALLGAALLAPAQEQSPQCIPQPLAHFHHLHLNATDPQAAIGFDTSKLDSEKRKFAGAVDAVWLHKSWLLFTKVKAEPMQISRPPSGTWAGEPKIYM